MHVQQKGQVSKTTPPAGNYLIPPKSQLHPKTGSQKAGWDWLKQKLLGVGNEINQVG